MNRLAFFLILVAMMIVGCNNPEKQMPDLQDGSSEGASSEVESTTVETTEQVTTVAPTTEAEVILPEVDYLTLKPNEVGQIMVVMYHGIEEDRAPYQRAENDFVKDLQYMYDNNYRLISMSDYKNSTIDIPAGMTPIVLTFDDGLSTTFSLEEVDGQWVPKKGTAIALLEAFALEHPDFGKEASFYINGDNDAFRGAGTLQDRLQWLVDHGYEIGNHTYDHARLSKLSGQQVQEEIGKMDGIIKEALPGYRVDVITYPFGIRPAEDLRKYVNEGLFENNAYQYMLGFREGVSGPMVAPLHIKFEPFNCPRVRGSEGEESDLWWWFKYYEEHPNYLYKSDGDPLRVAVSKENAELVNGEKLGQMALYLY